MTTGAPWRASSARHGIELDRGEAQRHHTAQVGGVEAANPEPLDGMDAQRRRGPAGGGDARVIAQTGLPLGEGISGGAERPSDEINRPTWGDDPGALAALEAVETAQAALDATYQLDEPERLIACAAAYRQRAEAWSRLAEAVPMNTPVPYVQAMLIASMADADRATDYQRWAREVREAGSGEAR